MLTANAIDLRKNLDDLLDAVLEYDKPVRITTQKGNAVLIREGEYRSLLETLYLMSEPGLVEKIKEGEKENVSDMTLYSPDKDW